MKLLILLLISLINIILSQTNDDYTPVEYTPNPNVATLHGLPRIFGENSLQSVTPDGVATITTMEGATYNYVAGIIIGPAIYTIIFLVWLVVLLFAKKCCKGCCNEWLGLVFFLGFGGFSAFCWFFAMGGVTALTTGVTTFAQAGTDLGEVFTDVGEIAAQVDTFISDLNTQALLANESCSFDSPLAAAFPLSELQSGISTIDESFTSDGIVDAANSANEQIAFAVGYVNQYVSWVDYVTWIFLVVMIGFVGFFIFTTFIRVVDKSPDTCSNLFRALNNISSYSVFIFGTIILLVLLVINCLFAIIALLGSDFCTPDPNATLATLAGTFLLESDLGAGICDNATLISESFEVNMLCYYTQCSGDNKVVQLLTQADLR